MTVNTEITNYDYLRQVSEVTPPKVFKTYTMPPTSPKDLYRLPFFTSTLVCLFVWVTPVSTDYGGL